MFKTDSFFSLNKNVWRDHAATMQQGYFVAFLGDISTLNSG